jgi:hypothetical protein
MRCDLGAVCDVAELLPGSFKEGAFRSVVVKDLGVGSGSCQALPAANRSLHVWATSYRSEVVDISTIYQCSTGVLSNTLYGIMLTLWHSLSREIRSFDMVRSSNICCYPTLLLFESLTFTSMYWLVGTSGSAL